GGSGGIGQRAFALAGATDIDLAPGSRTAGIYGTCGSEMNVFSSDFHIAAGRSSGGSKGAAIGHASVPTGEIDLSSHVYSSRSLDRAGLIDGHGVYVSAVGLQFRLHSADRPLIIDSCAPDISRTAWLHQDVRISGLHEQYVLASPQPHRPSGSRKRSSI